MLDDELTLSFIFVADSADPPSELAAFKSAHPDWVSFPATFIPHEQPLPESEGLRTQSVFDEAWEPPPRNKPIRPQPTRTDLGAALRAFQRASAEHPDPVAALRALRDAPEDFEDLKAPSPSNPIRVTDLDTGFASKGTRHTRPSASIQLADIASDLETLGGGAPRLVTTPKGATQFIFPNGMILRFDLSPGQYLGGQSPHINLELPGGGNLHIEIGP